MNSPPKTASLSGDLNNFIYGVSRRNFQNAPELTKTGISLLKSFPAARDAVLEYFAMVFHEAVNVSISQTEFDNDPVNCVALESVCMIGPELCSLGEFWAQFIAPWCIKLIMDIATEKANIPNNTLQNTEPIRILLDITTQNLTLLNSEERAKCIDMMIGCRSCSWAVGWVGRAEPALVAPRALALGVDAAKAVLAHLANHPPALFHVRAALLDLFHDAMRDDTKLEKREVIPYLLKLAAKSDMVLKALTQDIEQILTEDMVERLTVVYMADINSPSWASLSAGSIVSLLQKCDVNCFFLLLKLAQKNHACLILLENLLQKLEYECLFPDKKLPLLISTSDNIKVVRRRLLEGNMLEKNYLARLLVIVCYVLPSEFVSTISFLLQYSRDDATLSLLVLIILGTTTMYIPNDSNDLSMDTERYHNFIKTGMEYGLREAMLSDRQIKKVFIVSEPPKDLKTYLHHFCLNVIKLLRWENSNALPYLRPRFIGRAVEANLYRFGAALQEYSSLLRIQEACTMTSLSEMPTCHALAEVLDRIDMSGTKALPPSVEAILKVVKATVQYFFRCLHEKDIFDKLRGVQIASCLLRKLCLHSKLARSVALRDLLETAMFREEKTFASRSVVTNTVSNAKDWTEEELLIHLNRRHGPVTQLAQNHTSVFHAGVIGKGVRKNGDEDVNSIPPILTTNNELLMGALMSCMDGNTGIVEGATSISLLLVELLSPDVMYNGLPWPDEDFTKQVSIERELYMRSAIEQSSVVRACLARAAGARPSLCLASALLRATPATLLHTLRIARDRKTSSLEMEKEQTALSELLRTMTLGQLLPSPLCHMIELAPELTANELVQVLRICLWNYTRDHVPSPALFNCDSTGLHWRNPTTCKPPPTYTDTLRYIIQKRISKLGHLYPLMFLDLERPESQQ